MSSKNERTGQMSSNDFGAADIFEKMPWDIFRTCPRHVLCQKMSPKFYRGWGGPLPTKMNRQLSKLNFHVMNIK